MRLFLLPVSGDEAALAEADRPDLLVDVDAYYAAVLGALGRAYEAAARAAPKPPLYLVYPDDRPVLVPARLVQAAILRTGGPRARDAYDRARADPDTAAWTTADPAVADLLAGDDAEEPDHFGVTVQVDAAGLSWVVELASGPLTSARLPWAEVRAADAGEGGDDDDPA